MYGYIFDPSVRLEVKYYNKVHCLHIFTNTNKSSSQEISSRFDLLMVTILSCKLPLKENNIVCQYVYSYVTRTSTHSSVSQNMRKL